MISVSNNYLTELNKTAISSKSKIVVDGVEYLGNVIKTTPKISHSATASCGSFPKKTVSFEIYDFNNNLDFENKEITVYKGLVINNSIEYVKQGIFKPNARNITTNVSTKTITFKDVGDRTQLFENEYSSDLDYSGDKRHTGLEIIQELCNKRNVTLKNNDFAFANYEFLQPNFKENILEREVISRIAQIGGETAIFDSNGNLEIKSQFETNINIERSRYKKITSEKSITYNTVVLGNEGMDNDIVYPSTIVEDRVEFKILDNPFVDLIKTEIIEDVASHIIGLSYTPFSLEDFSDGFMFELNDVINIKDRNGNTTRAVILDYKTTSRSKSKIENKIDQKNNTNYKLAGSSKTDINEIKLSVDHNTKQIEALSNTTTEHTSSISKLQLDSQNISARVERGEKVLEETNSNIENNYYTKSYTEQLILNSSNGLTNTFSEAGGNNIFRNTNFSAKEILEEGQIFEYWYGNVERISNNNSVNSYSILLKADNLNQEQIVANGNYTISFYYKILNPLADVKVKINGNEYSLTEENYTLFQTGIKDNDDNYIVNPIVVNDNHLKIELISDIDDACEIYDIMANAGTVKLAYSQNQNEVITDNVNIGKGITITSSTSDVKFTANNDGIRTKDSNGNVLTDFTDKGMSTKEAIIENQSQIVGILRQRVGNQVWDSLI